MNQETRQKVLDSLQKLYNETGLFIQGAEGLDYCWVTQYEGVDPEAVMLGFDFKTKKYTITE